MGLFNWVKKKVEKKNTKTNNYSGRSNVSDNSSSNDTLTTVLWLSSMSDDAPSHSHHDSSPSYDPSPSYDGGGYDGASDGGGGGADW